MERQLTDPLMHNYKTFTGLYQVDSISYTEYMSKVARQRGAESANIDLRQSRKHSHRWNAALFIDNIFRSVIHLE